MKVYARQMNPEYQESPLMFGEIFWPEGITVAGNRDYKEHWDDDFRRVFEVLENEELADALDDFERYGGSDFYKNRTAAIMDFLWPKHKEKYSTQEVGKLCNIIPKYGFHRDDDDILCAVASIVLGKRYEHATIRGCCQGDWNDVFYPADEWDSKALENFETEYFNTGEEWMVHDEAGEPETPEDISGWTVYCHGWRDEDIRKEISDAAGVDPSEVVMYRISNTRHVTICEYTVA